jgi:RecB family exonuclease
MSGAKELLTGPHGAAVRDRLLDAAKVSATDLWLVPSSLARSQVLLALARSQGTGRAPRVWCWDDLWRAVGEAIDDGPARLSEASALAALGLAIDRAEAAGELRVTAGVVHRPGFRRRLRDRMAAWTRRECDPGAEPPAGDAGPEAADEWAVYRHYRATLRGLDAEDAEGFALWASKALDASPPASLRRLGTVTILDLPDDGPAVRRALAFFESRARSVRITLAYDPEPALADVYAPTAELRGRLIRSGYAETIVEPDPSRPAGLDGAERELFRSDAHTRPPLADPAGLEFLGAPKGEGVGLVVAREVRRRLGEPGVVPEDVLVLVPSWDEDADAVLGVLRSWDLPVSAVGRPCDLGAEPAVSLLRMAMRLPRDGWESAELVKLLRHGRFRPLWDVARGPARLPTAAAMVRDSGVFRGRDAILRALDRSGDRDSGREAFAVRALVERVILEIETLDRPGTWDAHTARLRQLAEAFGLDRDDSALQRFWNALDDFGWVVDGAGENGHPMPLSAFAAEVERLVAGLREREVRVRPGTVCLATVDVSAGARARYVLLANLGEGCFPTRQAVQADDSDDPAHVGPAYAREMSRFLRALGSADRGVTLAYPIRDEKGQEVLASVFLDELKRRIDPEALEDAVVELKRIDPSLVEHADLALGPADARVRAVALACVRHEGGELARLAGTPRHRKALEGAALALGLTARRLDRRGFGRYEGRFADPAAARALAARFGADAVFSPSQLESYLFCPFQFLLKYVLGLEPIDERDEVDEDFIRRGNRIHKLLEMLESLRRLDGTDRLSLSEIVIRTEMRADLTVTSEADRGLFEIERRRIEQTLVKYVAQADDYERSAGSSVPRPHLFEVVFGDECGGVGHPCLEIGEGASAVRLRGMIDRVDVIESGSGMAFRVIDYKTGAPPSKSDVMNNLMVQLPLYAMAVERLALAGEGAGLLDVGYWDLREKGFSAIDLKDWDAARARLEDAVLGVVGRLREGRFEVNPRRDDCQGTCDYANVCRIGQVRAVRKLAEDEPR